MPQQVQSKMLTFYQSKIFQKGSDFIVIEPFIAAVILAVAYSNRVFDGFKTSDSLAAIEKKNRDFP